MKLFFNDTTCDVGYINENNINMFTHIPITQVSENAFIK